MTRTRSLRIIILKNLVEDFEAACFNEVAEDGPDPDYRKFAKDEKEAIRNRLISRIEKWTAT